MAQKITAKKFTLNIIISISVQIVSLAVSFVTTLIVPKFIDEYNYAYWQTYVLYIAYVGILHFGLLDGMILRYSKYDYNELDKPLLRSQFKILLGFTGMLSAIGIIVSLFSLYGTSMLIALFVVIAITTKNAVTFSSYSFQITNRIDKYAILSLAQRAIYGVEIALLLILGAKSFYWFCIADLVCDVAGFCIAAIFNKGIYFGKSAPLKQAFAELKRNISGGIILMLANWSAMLLVSGAKMIVQWRWDELVFGKLSFAFSVSNVFLVFISAASVVLFSSLKRVDQAKLPNIYVQMRNGMSLLLTAVLLFYFPGCWLLEMWLPQYVPSLIYLGIMLPMIVYTSKVNLLTNNYLKAYRKERVMFFINLCTAILGLSSFALCAYVFDNVYALLYCLVGVIVVNSVASEIAVQRVTGTRIIKEFILEIAVSVAFILCAQLLSRWWAMLAYFGCLVVYSVLNYKAYVGLFGTIKGFLKKPKPVSAAVTTGQSTETESVNCAPNGGDEQIVESQKQDIEQEKEQ